MSATDNAARDALLQMHAEAKLRWEDAREDQSRALTVEQDAAAARLRAQEVASEAARRVRQIGSALNALGWRDDEAQR